MSVLDLRLLGRPSAVHGSSLVSLSAKAYALLGYLAHTTLGSSDSRVPRRKLAGLLWPASRESSARHSLSQCLYSIKRGVGNGQPPVRGNQHFVWLGPCDADIFRFSEAVNAEDWREASKRYSGSFLKGTQVLGGNDFNDWLQLARLQYHDTAKAVLGGLQIDGLWEEALGLCKCLLLQDPEDEALKETEVRIEEGRDRYLPTPNDRQGDLSRDPSGRVNGFAPMERQDSTARPTGGRFVGRKEEFIRLKEVFETSKREGPIVCLVQGEPGIGKTAILDRFHRWAAIKGARVLLASGYQLERNVPFGIVAQWLRQLELPDVTEPWSAVLRRAFPEALKIDDAGELSDLSGQDLSEVTSYRLQECLRRLFLHVSRTQLLILSLDDAHHADTASISFLHHLSRTSERVPLLQLISRRTPLAHGPSTGPLSNWRNAQRIQLPPLTRQDLSILIKEAGLGPSDGSQDRADLLFDKTRGNPFLVSALLRHNAGGTPEGLPDTVVDFLRPQLKELSSNARVVLNTLAVVGEETPLSTLRKVSALSSPAMLEGLVELEALGFVQVGEGGAKIEHGLVGDLAMANLPDSSRRSLFGRAARHLSAAGIRSPAVIAVQHDIAGNRDKAFATALTAANASKLLHAHAEREFFLKLAIANAPNADDRGKILLILAQLLTETGRPTEALEILDPAAFGHASPSILAAADAHRLLARFRLDGQGRKAFEEGPLVVKALGDRLDDILLAKVYSGLAAVAYDLGEGSACLEYGERAARIASQLSVSPESSRILISSVLIKAAYQSYQDGSSALQDLLPRLDGSTESEARFRIGRGMVALLAGNLIDAEHHYLESIELCEQSGLYDILIVAHNNLAVCYIEQGRYSDALIQLDAVYAPTDGVALRGVETAVDNLAQLRYEEGDYETAANVAESALAKTTKMGRSFFHLHGIRGLSALERGRIAVALESQREIELALGSADYWSSDMSYVEVFLARMNVMKGNREAAMERLSTALRVYEQRDTLCRARIEAEFIRNLLKQDPASARKKACDLREALSHSGAVPLLERIDGLITRSSLT